LATLAGLPKRSIKPKPRLEGWSKSCRRSIGYLTKALFMVLIRLQSPTLVNKKILLWENLFIDRYASVYPIGNNHISIFWV